MGIEKTRKLDRNLLSSAWWAFDLSCLSHIGGHGYAYATQKLNAFSNRVYKFHLLVKMLIKEQMQLVESRPAYLPMRFLIKIAERYRIGQQLIQLFRHFQTYRLLQFEGKQEIDGSICLDLYCTLVQTRLGAHLNTARSIFFCHGSLLFWLMSG